MLQVLLATVLVHAITVVPSRCFAESTSHENVQPAAAKKIKIVTATKVIDSHKRVVVALFAVDAAETNSGLGYTNQTAALVGFGGSSYLIGVSASGLKDQGVEFVFRELDCSGEPFLPYRYLAAVL